MVEESAYSAHVAAADPDSAHAAASAAEWDTPVTGDISRTILYTLQEDPLVGATAQQLSFEDDNNVPQEEHV